MDRGIREIGDSGIFGFRDLWISGFRNLGISGFEDLGIWRIRGGACGIWGFWNDVIWSFWALGLLDLRI